MNLEMKILQQHIKNENKKYEESFPIQIQKTVEDMEWEEDIVRFCGWSMERVQEEIHEIGIETGWHEDDDRQDILESLVGKILDDAKEYLLPKYYEQWKLSQA